MGSDKAQVEAAQSKAISIHAPCMGSDNAFSHLALQNRFQSTLPAGGATCARLKSNIADSVFQSTLPAGGATRSHWSPQNFSIYFNPRSPQGERHERLFHRASGSDFNPRSPQGERQLFPMLPEKTIGFQSTLPAGGATESPVIINPVVQFQSTLPAGGATT